MNIHIEAKTTFQKDSKICYLHVDEETKKYVAEYATVTKIIIEPIEDYTSDTTITQYNLYYMTSTGKLIPEKDAFAHEWFLWERYKDVSSVIENRLLNNVKNKNFNT